MALFTTLNGILGLSLGKRTVAGNTPFVFSSATVSQNSARTIDENTIIVAYRDTAPGTAQILDISGGTITGNTAFVFKGDSTADIALSLLLSTKGLVVYRNSVNARAKVLTISGGSISGGAEFNFAGNAQFTTLETISSTKAIVCYSDFSNSSFGTAQILDISGTTVTGNTTFVFESAGTSNLSVQVISSTQVLVCYSDNGNGGFGTAQILDISGGTITGNTAFVFESAATNHISLQLIENNRAIVCYSDGGNSSKGTAQILTISGTTITGNTAFVFEENTTLDISIQFIDSINTLVSYRDFDNSNFGTAQVLNILGETITGNIPFVFESAGTNDISLQVLNNSKSIVCYQDFGNSSNGTSQILDIA